MSAEFHVSCGFLLCSPPVCWLVSWFSSCPVKCSLDLTLSQLAEAPGDPGDPGDPASRRKWLLKMDGGGSRGVTFPQRRLEDMCTAVGLAFIRGSE